ncbi:uncharacterized protein [Asterias amurensis]|uniref:uncharacterized protein n=1 Tax=Asterias amurensis TaxID=7602 RepID=UPI003AB340FB
MKNLCILVFLLICVGYCQAKFCYSCTGFDGSSCGSTTFWGEDPRVGKTECPRFCVKEIGTDELTKKRVTTRGCAGNDCKDGTVGGVQKYCCEFTELCNGASKATTSLAVFAAAAIFALLV